MINKSYVFGGGLLVNTIAIFASISSDTVAKEDLRDFRSELNQIVWDMDCSWQEFYIHDDIHATEDTKENAWILEPKYEDSRTKVIGKAIADCVTGENEFKDKNAADIITFEGTKPETYKQKHWNAFILYNYIHEAINREGLPENKNEYTYKLSNVKKLLEDKLGKLKANYGKNEYGKAIDDAVQVIQEYVKALTLNEELYEFRQHKQEYDNNQDIKYIAPRVSDSSDNNKLTFTECFYQFDDKRPNQIFKYCPTFECADNQLHIAELYIITDYRDENSSEWKAKDNPTIIVGRDNCRSSDLCQWLFERLKGLVERAY